MLYKKKPIQPETNEEIVKYRRIGLIFTTHNSLLDDYSKKKEGLDNKEILFCRKHKLGARNYVKIKGSFIKNGKQSVINIFRRNKLKLSKCEEVIEFLSENIK
ncbi:MAG: hypothetical protein O7C59_04100 [Rickettsia endosymbiont of Ixodes persulcatus]|nr:hypothetical protein [Rickettsia endosymbiont of Ixodes persulcatus]